jgi:hypothetical protein
MTEREDELAWHERMLDEKEDELSDTRRTSELRPRPLSALEKRELESTD